MSDKMWRGDKYSFICPITRHKYQLDEDNSFNFLLYSSRQAVERVIKRVRNWGCLNVVWRLDLGLLGDCAHVCALLTNLFLCFEPLG